MIPPSNTGIDFVNKITESDTFNILTEEYIYNGGGACDFNNDGLADLFFTGNLGSNRLYVNKGGLKFQDVLTAMAGAIFMFVQGCGQTPWIRIPFAVQPEDQNTKGGARNCNL